ncbi:MAG: putative phosphothreonine lyase domain-containing protein [Halobacteriaceae archaeon]
MPPETRPTEIADGETVWVRSREAPGCETEAGDDYFDRHGVARVAETTAADLPPADSEAVRGIDRDALAAGKLIGKWQVTGSKAAVAALWPEIVADVDEQTLWAAKVMTATGYAELPYDDYVIAVYTPNYFERHDIERVRERLRERGVAHDCSTSPTSTRPRASSPTRPTSSASRCRRGTGRDPSPPQTYMERNRNRS